MANPASDELVAEIAKAFDYAKQCLDGVVSLDDEDEGEDGGSAACQATVKIIKRAEKKLAALLARLEAEKAEVERLRELFKVQSDSHAKHVRGLLAQHAVELDIYAKAAQDFREQAQAEKARADKAMGHWNTQPTTADLAAANYRAKDTERRLAEVEAERDRLAAVVAEVRNRDESAWLIEHGDSSTAQPRYWAGAGAYCEVADARRSSSWTENHMQAIRFARKVDATRAAERCCHGITVRICEHMWMSSQGSNPLHMDPEGNDTISGVLK